MSKKPCGFTLVELLVVIAIIGVRVALLLPAVQQARESGRRSQCQNNLKQMALGVHNYHDLNRILPASKVTIGACCGSPSKSNWCIELLPYIEQKSLYDTYDFKVNNEDPPNAGFRISVVATYICPTDTGASAKKIQKPVTGPGSNLDYRRSSYKAMGGKYDGVNSKWDTGEGPPMKVEWRGPLHIVTSFSSASTVVHDSFANITDGLSNTTLIAEYTTKIGVVAGDDPIRRAPFWAYSYGGYNAGCATDQARTLLADYAKCNSIGGAGGIDPCKRAFGSFHPGGLNTSLCDGSVRYIPLTINMNIWTAMATIAGDEAVTIP